MAPCAQLPVWATWHFARVQLPFCNARSLTFYHLSCHCILYCLHLTGHHLKGRKCFFLALSGCLGFSGSLELLLGIFASMTGEGMGELEVGLGHFRSLATVCHLKDADNVMWEWLNRIAEGGLWKWTSILQHCQGNSSWSQMQSIPGILLMWHSILGTPIEPLSVVCVSWLHSL